MTAERYEDTIEGRVLAYFDFIFVTAENFLRSYAENYGFDLKMEAQDIAQEVARKVLESDAYGPSLGVEFFKVTTENLCKNFIRERTNDFDKGQRWGSSVSWIERPDNLGWMDLTAKIRKMHKAERIAIAEAYFGYKAGELSGTPNGSWSAMKRARKVLRAQIELAA